MAGCNAVTAEKPACHEPNRPSIAGMSLLRVQRLFKAFCGHSRGRFRQLRGAPRRNLRPARAQRRGQDHHHFHDLRVAQTRCGRLRAGKSADGRARRLLVAVGTCSAKLAKSRPLPPDWLGLKAFNQLISFGCGFEAVLLPLAVLLGFGLAANLLAARLFKS